MVFLQLLDLRQKLRGNTEVVRTLLVLSCLLAAAVTPAFAVPPSDGTLSVREGRGMVQLKSRGTMIGKINRGRVVVTDANPYDTRRPIVLGQERTVYKSAKMAIYSGRDIRVRVTGGLTTVRFEGRGIELSAVGRGHGSIEGAGDPAQGLFYDGVWSLNDEEYSSLPDSPTAFQLVGPPGSQ
jgi:hypothetical protein